MINKSISKGYSLIEVLISLVILSIISISFLIMFLFVNNTTINSLRFIDENYIAQNIIENIKGGKLSSDISSINKEQLRNSGFSIFEANKFRGELEIKSIDDSKDVFYIKLKMSPQSKNYDNPMELSTIINKSTYDLLFSHGE